MTKEIHLFIYVRNDSRLHRDCNILPTASSDGTNKEQVRPKEPLGFPESWNMNLH